MNHLEVYADGRNIAKKGSGFSVILLSMNNKWLRSLSFGNYSVNQIDMLAVKFGLLSIADSHSNLPVKIFSKNKYVRDMLERDNDGHYKKIARANKHLVEDLRSLIQDKEIELLPMEDTKGKICKKLAEEAIKDDKEVNIQQ